MAIADAKKAKKGKHPTNTNAPDASLGLSQLATTPMCNMTTVER